MYVQQKVFEATWFDIYALATTELIYRYVHLRKLAFLAFLPKVRREDQINSVCEIRSYQSTQNAENHDSVNV